MVIPLLTDTPGQNRLGSVRTMYWVWGLLFDYSCVAQLKDQVILNTSPIPLMNWETFPQLIVYHKPFFKYLFNQAYLELE